MKRAGHRLGRAVRMSAGSDRTILAAGIVVGAIMAVLSLFSPVPGRVVERVTGIGAPRARPEPTRDAVAQDLIRRGRHGEAVDLLAQLSSERPSSARRFARYICALSLGQWTDQAIEELEAWSATTEGEPGSAEPSVGARPFELDFLEGAWVGLDDDGRIDLWTTVHRLAHGRAYVQRWYGNRSEAVIVFLIDPYRGQWTRTLVMASGRMAFYRGSVAGRELCLEGGVYASPNDEFPDIRITLRQCDDGTVERIQERREVDGAWGTEDVMTYVRIGESSPDSMAR